LAAYSAGPLVRGTGGGALANKLPIVRLGAGRLSRCGGARAACAVRRCAAGCRPLWGGAKGGQIRSHCLWYFSPFRSP